MSSAEQLASVTPLPGVINRPLDTEQLEQSIASPLPTFDLGIDEIKVGKTKYFDGGAHIDRQYRLNNGAVFVGRLTVSRSGNFDTLLSHRLPWCTELNGMYTEVDEEHARRGSTSIRVSPEKTGIFRAAHNVVDAIWGPNNMLARDAYVQHLILDDIDSLGIAEPDQAIETGDSKAAMTNPAVLAYAAKFGRLIRYSDTTDPCLEHALSLDNLTPEAAAKNTKYLLINEPRELKRAVRTHPLHKLPRLARTAPLTPGFWLHQVATGFALFSGKSGGFVDHIPNETVAAVRFFNHSEFNHSLDWLRRLDPFKNVYVYQEPGSHMSLADLDVQMSTIDRVEEVQNRFKDGVTPEELDIEMIVKDVQVARLAARSGQSNHAVRRPVQTVS